MEIDAEKMEALRSGAKAAFEIAVALEVYRPEGVAILMKSGLVVTGYTQYDSNGNAAKDALRVVNLRFPEDAKHGTKALNHFTIASALVLTQRAQINPATMATLNDYSEVVAGAQILHARLGAGSDKSYVAIQKSYPLREHI